MLRSVDDDGGDVLNDDLGVHRSNRSSWWVFFGGLHQFDSELAQVEVGGFGVLLERDAQNRLVARGPNDYGALTPAHEPDATFGVIVYVCIGVVGIFPVWRLLTHDGNRSSWPVLPLARQRRQYPPIACLLQSMQCSPPAPRTLSIMRLMATARSRRSILLRSCVRSASVMI